MARAVAVPANPTAMLAVPSKDVPPMVRAVARAVAVAASVAFAGVMLAVPSNDVPPIVRAVARAVAVEALPVKGPANAVAVAVPVTVIP